MGTGIRYCSKCKKTLSETNFYKLPSGERSDMCKACETMHINNYEPDTFMWLLEKYDVPYIEAEWNVLRDRAYQKNPYKMNGMSVFGKYLSKMKLSQFKTYKFADTARLKAEAEALAEQAGASKSAVEQKIEEMKEAYENGEISESQFKTYVNVVSEPTPLPPPPEALDPKATQPQTVESQSNASPLSPYPDNDHPFEEVTLPDMGANLTEEDKVYLAMKWGRLYTAADWVTLENMYKDYETSFDLHNADLIRGTIQLCKLDLKENAALDSGDMDSYSKLARASDSLRKSLKFTEAQRKEEKTEEFDSYGKIVAFAEKYNNEDYIHPIDLSIDRDIVDRDIRDMKHFISQIVEDDPVVFKMIEQYIKKREILSEKEKAENMGKDFVLTDEDFKEHNEYIEEQKEIDNSFYDDDDED